jgi:hypothetical protein
MKAERGPAFAAKNPRERPVGTDFYVRLVRVTSLNLASGLRALFADRLAADGVADRVQNVNEVARLADFAEQGSA